MSSYEADSVSTGSFWEVGWVVILGLVGFLIIGLAQCGDRPTPPRPMGYIEVRQDTVHVNNFIKLYSSRDTVVYIGGSGDTIRFFLLCDTSSRPPEMYMKIRSYRELTRLER